MRARDVFMQSLVAHGVERIFGNPGTTESPLLDSLAAYPQLAYVTALHEGVALGAASFYAQASGKTGIVSLHVAPGLGNAMGMLYCALRARSPMIVTAGQQDTRMRLNDPVLGHDLVAMAAPVTKWSVQVERGDEMGPILRRAFKVAHDYPRGPVFVSLPIDVMEQETAIAPTTAGAIYRAATADRQAISAMAEVLAAARSPVVVCGDDPATAGATGALVRLAETLGASVWFDGVLRAQQPFPTAHPSCRLGLGQDAATTRKLLGDADVVLLVGGPFFEDVWFSPGSPFPAGAKILQIESSAEKLGRNHALDIGAVGVLGASLSELADALAKNTALVTKAAARNANLKAAKEREIAAQRTRAEKSWDRVPASMPRVMAEIRDALPVGTVVVDESITAAIDLGKTLDFAAPGDYFSGRGGGIGQGLAGAIGVKAAMPDRPVVCISGDGSAMYSIQALWSAAHNRLPIVFVILANREYRVLKHNIDAYRLRFGIQSQEPYAHMDLGGPQLGFVEMAAGMGVAGTRVGSPDAIGPAIDAAFESGQPHVVEIAIEAKR